MIRNIVPHIIFLIIFSLFLNKSQASELNWKPAQDGNKIIFIRHSLAPGGGDPDGIDQSKKIGEIFKKNNIPIDQVLSSQWCRCKDTAKYAFKDYKVFTALNSTFRSPDDKKAKKQIKELKNFVENWNGDGGNLILVTHYIIITAVTNAVPQSGEIIITDKNLKVLSAIKTLNHIKKK